MFCKTIRLTIDEVPTISISLQDPESAAVVADFFAGLSNEESRTLAEDVEGLIAVYQLLSSWRNPKINICLEARIADGTKVGYVRFFGQNQNQLAIDICIAEVFRSQGYGCELIAGAIHKLREITPRSFVAHVRPNNIASIQMFERLGAQLQPPTSKAEAIILRTYLL